MKETKTVLLTGAGGVAMPGLIAHMRKLGFRVLVADMDEHAAGLYLADAGFIIPAGKSKDFLPALRKICLDEKVHVVITMVDEELSTALSLEKDGIAVIAPRRRFIEICLDKFELMKQLKAAGIRVPQTRLAIDGPDGLAFPLVIKPRTGRGSRGLGILESKANLDAYIETSSYSADELILQDYVEGPEYTVSVVCWRDGEIQAVVPKKIIVKKGVTHLAVTKKEPKIDALCKKIQASLGADGPFNVQLRIDEQTGEPFPFEINPRFSTTVSLTMASGVDEIGGLVEQALNGREKYCFGEWQEGLVMLRQTLDAFLDEETFLNASIKHFEKGII